LPVIQHVVKVINNQDQYKPDTILLLQPTSPFRESKHIFEALTTFFEGNADSLVSVIKVPHNFNPFAVMSLAKDGYLVPYQDYDERKNIRQLKPIFYARNGAAIYICTYDCLMKKNSLYGDKILPYEMDRSASVDIDDEWDWKLAELMLSHN
jgi:CMP-N-acetylneuraminic acid synthetase